MLRAFVTVVVRVQLEYKYLDRTWYGFGPIGQYGTWNGSIFGLQDTL